MMFAEGFCSAQLLLCPLLRGGFARVFHFTGHLSVVVVCVEHHKNVCF